MEILHAFIYTTRYIFKNGNLDWYYFVALFLLIVMCKKREMKKYYQLFFCFGILFIIMELGSILFSGLSYSLFDTFMMFGKITLCLVLMIATIKYFPQFKKETFLLWSVGILAIETVVAFFVVKEPLWRLNDIDNGFFETRLQLFFIEPSELSMCAALLLLLIVYLIEETGFKKIYIPCVIVLVIDMYLSAGMGGVLSLGIAIGIGIMYKTVELAITQKKYYGFFILGALLFIAWILIYKTDFAMTQRIRMILSGREVTDSSKVWRLTLPLRNILPILRNTNYMGVGQGNFNSELILSFREMVIGTYGWFPNSFLYFIAESGVIGLVSLVSGVIYLANVTLRSKRLSIIMLFAFIMIYQIPGGYFTNPLNWICYGVILTTYGPKKESKKAVAASD